MTGTGPLFFLLAGLVSCAAGRLFTAAETDRLNGFVRETIRCSRPRALGLALVRNGAVIFKRGYGLADPASRRRATDDTRFCIGDSTQAFTATLLAQLLADSSRYSWTTPIRDILGTDFCLTDAYRSRSINLQDIFTHRTGLSNLDAIVTAKAATLKDIFDRLTIVPETHGFREQMLHNNILFTVVQEVAEKLGEKSWEMLMQDRILNPLGMKGTTFIDKLNASRSSLAVPTMKANSLHFTLPLDALSGYGLVKTASGICSSTKDMGKWLAFHLKNGRNRTGHQVVNNMALSETYNLQMSLPSSEKVRTDAFKQPQVAVSYSRFGYGLGWITGSYRGFDVLSNSGELPGYQTLISIIPSRDIGVYLSFTGLEGDEAYVTKMLITIHALDLLLNGDPWINRSNLCKERDKIISFMNHQHQTEPSPSVFLDALEPEHDPNAYTGLYTNAVFGNVQVSFNSTTDRLELTYGELGHYILDGTVSRDVFKMNALSPLYYSTHADIYTHQKNPYYYVYFNSSINSDTISMLIIPDFDTHIQPVFRMLHNSNGLDDAFRRAICGSCMTMHIWTLIACSSFLSVWNLLNA